MMMQQPQQATPPNPPPPSDSSLRSPTPTPTQSPLPLRPRQPLEHVAVPISAAHLSGEPLVTMGAAALPLARVRLSDISPYDGAPSASYVRAVEAFSGSLMRHNAAVIEFGNEDAALMRCALEAARLYFRSRVNTVGKGSRGFYMYRAGSGYLALEYTLLGQLTKKADVYSFGVLLLEIISGKSSSKAAFGVEFMLLLEWTWKLKEEDRLLDIVDPELSQYPEEEVLRFIKVV
ncbi:hypothetical protein GOBAR_DD12304 [Gossypium barbadense]|nr:hypothetical protein GOBAR_DD12304 [Gossypium barbadense]